MRRNYYIVGLVFLVFFVLSFLTNILGPIIPDIIRSFDVSLTTAAFLPFSFFIAYGLMSIPAGFLVERFSDKTVMTASFAVAMTGALCFALFPSYRIAVLSLFVMGVGMATLQVVVNPLLRSSGGEENFAFNSALAQFMCGLASFAGPRLYAYLVGNLEFHSERSAPLQILASLTRPSLRWVSMYWVFAVLAAVMVLIVGLVPLPPIQRTEEEKVGTLSMYSSLLRIRAVWLYFIGVFAYVGSEQGTADWISQFLFNYHGIDPHTRGASAVSLFWGLLTIGCLVGMALLKIFDSRKVLIGFSCGALVCLSFALFGSSRIALVAFPFIGLFASIMWPTIVSLALNSVEKHHGSFAGILCTGIAGGAVVPLVIGHLGDVFGLRAGMAFLYLSFGFVLWIGFWAKPIIANETISTRKARAEAAWLQQS